MASEQFSLCWDNFHKNMSSGLNALLETEELVDVTLAVEGKYLKAHKMVLSVCSPYFKELFKANPCQHPIVFMKDVSYVAISDLLQFMYQGEVQVSQDNLTTFIKTAEALQIKGLTGDGNGSADTETDSTQDVKSTSSGGRQHADTDYKPTSRPKKQPVPSPISVPPPMLSKAPKRPRLSVSSNDSQSNPPAAAAASITKTEPISLLPETNAAPVQQFKVEPYDQNQSVTIPDDGDDHFGDETLDDTTVDDTEDYSMMEGEETEPQAGTSADGTGEGQAHQQPITLNALFKNQQKMLKHHAHMQRSLDLLTNLVYNYFNAPVPKYPDSSSTTIRTLGPLSSNVNLFEPVDSVEQLNELENRLKDETFMSRVVDSMSFVCGQHGDAMGIDCCYKLIDYFITRSFATQCSWTGNSREGGGKIPLKFYGQFRRCFRRIVTLADSRFTETDNDEFFKRVMKNSVKRSQSGALRISKHKNRPKKLKYNWGRARPVELQSPGVLMGVSDEGGNNERESYIKIDVDSEPEALV